MIPAYRYFEVACYSLLNFLPFLFLAAYAFRRHLRFSHVTTNILVILMCLLQISLGFIAAFSTLGSEVLSVASTFVYAGFLFLIIKDSAGKVIFVLLTLSNVGNLVSVFAKCLEYIFFGDIALELYRWSQSVCMVILHLLITVPVGFYIRKYFTSSTPIQSTCWHYLWIVPATFYLTWYYHLYFTGQDALAVALDIRNSLFLLLINIGAFAVYHISILLLFEQRKVSELAQKNHFLAMHKLQYDNLQYRIDEARQAKHDVRHHALLLREYLRNGKLQEMDAYLEKYIKSLPDTQSLTYCRHDATNTLLGYFARQASESNILMDIFVQLPETISLSETELSIVFGNLLENALDACREIPSGEKKITVRGKYDMGAVYFEVTNTYSGALRKSKTGEYLTTKAHGQGIGLQSVSHRVQNYGGVMELVAHDGVFKASVLLPEQGV